MTLKCYNIHSHDLNLIVRNVATRNVEYAAMLRWRLKKIICALDITIIKNPIRIYARVIVLNMPLKEFWVEVKLQ